MRERCWLHLTATCMMLVLLTSLAAAQLCPEPEDIYAVEAVLTAPGVKLHFRALGEAKELVPGVYAYRSGFDERVVVLLYYSAAPPLSVSSPAVRFQVPVVDGKPLYNLTSEELCRTARLELERLSAERVLEVGSSLLTAFSTACESGKAGWDRRLIWLNGSWVSYYRVPGAVPQTTCRAPLPLNPAEIPVWPAQNPLPLYAVVAPILAATLLVSVIAAKKKIRTTAVKKADQNA